jgi:hypothetical protein
MQLTVNTAHVESLTAPRGSKVFPLAMYWSDKRPAMKNTITNARQIKKYPAKLFSDEKNFCILGTANPVV